MRVLDLFSGIGGFSLGLERAGMETAAFCEPDEFCHKVLHKHWPEVPIYKDVRDVTADQLRRDGVGGIDLICGGFPCQDISPAGRGEGIEGGRSGLWKDFARLIGELRPGFAIVENSSALLSRGLGVVLGDLAEVGYDAEWFVLSASQLGAPHQRERVWVVAYPEGFAGLHESITWEAVRCGLLNNRTSWPAGAWSSPEAGVCGVDDGVPNRVDRTAGLGNAVVPQIPEMIGRAIMQNKSPA